MVPIQETVIRDIIDLASDVKDSDEIQAVMNRNRSFSSIANASANLTLVFPVLCSNTLSIDTATMIAKAIERKAVTMLQMVFSAVCISDATNAYEYLRNFHQNLNLGHGMTVDEFIRLTDKMENIGESYKEAFTIKDANKHIQIEVKEMMNMVPMPDAVSEASLGDYYVMERYGSPVVFQEAPAMSIDFGGARTQDIKNIADALDKELNTYKNQLMSSDVKKANELVPTMMIVRFIDTEHDNAVNTFVCGVKAKLIPMDSQDIINRVMVKNQDRQGLVKFIRATTKEIGFFRDFIFAIDKAKIDALSQSRRGSSSKLWKVLERRALKSKIRMALGHSNDASMITTLVMSDAEVEYLRREGINVSDPRVIRPIMESYNLMSIVLVNEADETASFIFDTADDMYETLSFNSLEREAQDNSYKKVVNLMAKYNR